MTERVVRGGGWVNTPRYLLSANRSWNIADVANHNHGFRLLQEDAKGASRVMRGGSWVRSSNYICCAHHRDGRHPDVWSGTIGFRLVQEVRDE